MNEVKILYLYEYNAVNIYIYVNDDMHIDF